MIERLIQIQTFSGDSKPCLGERCNLLHLLQKGHYPHDLTIHARTTICSMYLRLLLYLVDSEVHTIMHACISVSSNDHNCKVSIVNLYIISHVFFHVYKVTRISLQFQMITCPVEQYEE